MKNHSDDKLMKQLFIFLGIIITLFFVSTIWSFLQEFPLSGNWLEVLKGGFR